MFFRIVQSTRNQMPKGVSILIIYLYSVAFPLKKEDLYILKAKNSLQVL